MAYHSRTRFATSKSGVEAFVPFSATASSNINLSISRGRYGSREFMQDMDGCSWSQIKSERHKVKLKYSKFSDFPFT